MAQEINYSSLQLAFLGDAVYELYIRDLVLKEVSGHVDKLNRSSKALSRAIAQAKIADLLMEKEFLSEEEAAVYRRGRNAKSASVPKTCSPQEYRKATGLEALMGYLHLNGREERIAEILEFGIAEIGGLERTEA